MKVALIYGDAHAGKTNMCRRINDLLSMIPGVVKEFHLLEKGDFKSKIKLPTCSISIYSAGDDQETLTDSVAWANLCNCDYHLGALRKNVKYQDIISKFKTTDNVIWISL